MPTFIYNTAPTTTAPVSFDSLYKKMLPHFKFFANRLMRRMGRGISDYDDVIQELTAIALELHTSLVRRGKTAYFSPIMKFAIKRYKAGRRCTGSNTTDVHSEQTQRLGRSAVCQLSVLDSEPLRWDFVQYKRHSDVFDIVQLRIDYETWLTMQSPRDQSIVKALSYGFTTNEVAKMHNVSAGLISQYRRRYRDSWDTFIADKRETGNEMAA
jgi:DNA-directed RNA polymerase specialized sigma24 family protein